MLVITERMWGLNDHDEYGNFRFGHDLFLETYEAEPEEMSDVQDVGVTSNTFKRMLCKNCGKQILRVPNGYKHVLGWMCAYGAEPSEERNGV